MAPKNKVVSEFGDFQTPEPLSLRICKLIDEKGVNPASIIEPTFGTGSFLASSLSIFREVAEVFGLEINPEYFSTAMHRLEGLDHRAEVNLVVGDFFLQDWYSVIKSLPKPILIIGNPPWVTNSELSAIDSENLPEKSNIKNLSGFDALTGGSNFDISEWMIIKLVESSIHHPTVLAMLCKTSVARNALKFFWKNQIPISETAIYIIDTKAHFSASVDACLLFIKLGRQGTKSCKVYSGISDREVIGNFGYRDGLLIADVDLYNATKHLAGQSSLRWRSGVKHDCSMVMELSESDEQLLNGFGEVVNIEDDFIFPLLKSSDVANSNEPVPSRWMLVPQRHPGDDTSIIKDRAPRTWHYLSTHSQYLDKRKSSIYRRNSRFSVFGVGDYSFLPWKVAISGLYKKINFALISPYQGKPIVLDDTCYFLSFNRKEQAELVQVLLSSDLTSDFFHSYIFWDNKRPITARLLKKLDISKLANDLGFGQQFQNLIQAHPYRKSESAQLTLLETDN